MKLLSEEFLTHPAHDRFPPLASGWNGRIQFSIPGGPDGEVKLLVVYRDGRCEERSLATDRGAEVALTLTYTDLLAVLDGEADLNVLYMTGRLKTADVSGTGALLDLIAALGSDEGSEALAELRAAVTER